MKIEEGDLIVKQKYGEARKRLLRMNKGNAKVLLEEWEDLLAAEKEVREDKKSSLEIGLGDRIKVSTSSDYPNLSFRRFHPSILDGRVFSERTRIRFTNGRLCSL